MYNKVTYGRASVLLGRQRNKLCTSGFLDDVIMGTMTTMSQNQASCYVSSSLPDDGAGAKLLSTIAGLIWVGLVGCLCYGLGVVGSRKLELRRTLAVIWLLAECWDRWCVVVVGSDAMNQRDYAKQDAGNVSIMPHWRVEEHADIERQKHTEIGGKRKWRRERLRDRLKAAPT